MPGRPSRRRFLGAAALAAGSLVTPGRQARALAQPAPPPAPAYLADVTGDGVLSGADTRLVRNALFSSRGFDLRPNADFDHRADLFGQGAAGREALDLVAGAVARRPGPLGARERRPITVAWHYGWYTSRARVPGSQTVALLGGDYASSDREVEGRFNELKNEFGITVDALSWIAPRDNANLLDNYRLGYFRGAQVATRHVALIYESSISLLRTSRRIDWLSPAVRSILTDDFGQMAAFLREVRETTPARIFVLDGRPVLFVFGSHRWGVSETAQESDAIDDALQAALARFADTYGAFPYLAGDEIPWSLNAPLGEPGRRRLANFDAVFSYHHANLKTGPSIVLPVGRWYVDYLVRQLRHAIAAVGQVANRHTRRPVLIIPSLAPGFAKSGFPTLSVDRGSYAELIAVVREAYLSEYLTPWWASEVGGPRLPAPVYTVGSWNEEFEGHAIFPSRFNLALGANTQNGFDVPMTIKRAFGWNHYAERGIGG